MKKPLPCPFCGIIPNFKENKDVEHGFILTHPIKYTDGSECPCSGFKQYLWENAHPSFTTDLWNRRIKVNVLNSTLQKPPKIVQNLILHPAG